MNYTDTIYPRANTAAAAKAQNSRRTCMAAGCLEHREGLYLHCKTHQRVFQAYGHPKARPIKPVSYHHYRKAITDIFTVNTTHPGLVAALDWVSRWMKEATASEAAFNGADQIARIVRHGVSPREVLTEVCSYYSFIQQNPRAHPDSRSEAFGISRAVFQLAPMPRRITHEAMQKGSHGYPLRPRFSALDSVGQRLRTVLSYLLANIAQAVVTRDQQAAETLHQLRAPLVSPTAVFLSEAAAIKPTTTAPRGHPFPNPTTGTASI